jgi:hypothetical protein
MSYACLRTPQSCDGCGRLSSACQTIATRSLIEAAVAGAARSRLQAGIAEEANSVPSLARLVRLERSPAPVHTPGLLPPVAAPLPLSDQS